MGDLTQSGSIEGSGQEAHSPMPVTGGKRHQSHAGYWFNEDAATWNLDKDNTVYIAKIRDYLDGEILKGCIATLVHYARTKAASHTCNIFERVYAMLRDTNGSTFTTSSLINYRATLSRENEWYLGTIRGFLYKWHDLGYPGISDDIVDLLKGWTLKGNIKGDAVKRMDPTEGPLTDNELMAFNEGAVRAFEQNQISITQLALALVISNTGRRPRQIAHTKVCDLDGTKKNKKSEPMYLIHIPRAKQRGETFRNSFKAFAMTAELWAILHAQRKHSIESVEQALGYELQDADRRALPLFPDLDAFSGITSIAELRTLLATDQLHIKSSAVTGIFQKVVTDGAVYSERTGNLLDIVATRFRYTKGTRAAREGFGLMVIAELLDQTDIQNAGVYTKNVPEHAHALNKAMALQLAPYAQAFQGILVDHEEDAKRGNDPASRIKYRGEIAATCGQYGFCGANVPIPCYTCNHFQPWLNGPHEEVLADLLAERERVEEITGDVTMASVNDRTIFAVINVIQRCDTRRNELAQMARKERE
jgi:integrase